MATYQSFVQVNLSPDSARSGSVQAESTLSISWNYPNCTKSWFRVAGSCFRPAPQDGCPPYPDGGLIPANCQPQDFSLTDLFVTGVDDNNQFLAYCDEDHHSLILPSQYPFVINPSTLPPGLSPETTAQYIGIACDGSAPVNNYTFRFFFVMPTNVAVSTLELDIVLDSPNAMFGISVNNKSAGLSSAAPLIAKKFVLSGAFKSDVNYIDVTLVSTGYLALMAQFPTARACVSQGKFPYGVNSGCLVSLSTNVLACDAEDVCRILKSRNLIFPISSIRKIDSSSLDYNCYTNVTPTIEDCDECCDFLIDENIFDEWYGFSGAIEEFQYTSKFNLSFIPKSANRIAFGYDSVAKLSLFPKSTEATFYNDVLANFLLSFKSNSIAASSYHYFQSNFNLSYDPQSLYFSDSYQFISQFMASLDFTSMKTPIAKITDRFSLAFAPRSALNFIFKYPSKVILGLKPNSVKHVDGYKYSSKLNPLVNPSSGYGGSIRRYVSNFNLDANPYYRGKWRTISDVNFAFKFNSGYSISYHYPNNWNLSIKPDSNVVSSNYWHWIDQANINVFGNSSYSSSDLGLIETEGFFVISAIEQPVVFDVTPAPAISTAIPSISVPCCSSISERLQFRHNLNSIPKFGNFLKRNGIVLPGTITDGRSNSFIPVTYSPRQDQWIGNIYLTGISPSESGNESWNLAVEFGCTDSWRIAIRLFKKSTSEDTTFRMVINYPSNTVCSAAGFTGFAAAVSAVQEISVPEATNLTVNDEESLVILPLLLQFSVETSGLQILFPVDLEKQLKAATAALF